MEKQKTMRGSVAGSQRALARSGTTTTRRMDSTKSLVPQESRRRLAPTSSATGLAPEDPLATENELYGTNSSSNNNNGNSSTSTSSSFDKLEVLGPSLLEVLTLVNPPKPRAQQEQEQQDSQMQQAGEDTTQDGGDFGSSNQHFHTSSGASLSGSTSSSSDPYAGKFDTCVSRSAILGKISDASVDNSRKTQEYFAKILDKLKIEATGLVLLQDSTIVLFLETTADQFLVLCRQLLQQKIIESASMRILASCDDNPERILQGLYFKKVTVNRSAGGGGGDSNGSGSSEWTDDSLTQHAVETFLNLIKFVKKIGPMAPAEIRKCLTNLSNTDQLFLPANDLVLWLLTREELMGLDEFLQVFDSPVAIELESERVWPVHPLIHY